ncbi:MAG: 2-oxoacid:acceptor oxidoreductase subunit alpha [Candidatus Omnitrophica bacterium]|nr:2-oxoacid:acceptor oxidoreductase subunit alpha [Candidatus Omnitrophota bacterium]
MALDHIFRFGGEGGEGVISCGDLFTLTCARSSLEIYTFLTYPAEIKGGHAWYQVRVSDQLLLSQGSKIDVLVAFNREAYDKHYSSIRDGGVLVYDNTDFLPDEDRRTIKYPIPFTKIAMEEIGVRLTKNLVALGALSSLFSVPRERLEGLVRDKFGRKGEQVLQKNMEALAAGARYVEASVKKQDSIRIEPPANKQPKLMLSGNESLTLGALAAGLKIYAGYPITPASSILEMLAKELPKVGGTIIQTEDEIAALGVVLGASFAGRKAMTATAGPGLSLMVEMMGLATMAELPAVIVDAQRAGPSTGMPTKTEQSDLNIAIFGGHGDSPRVVLALSSVEDCFYGMIRAFNFAEKYQTPVIVLSDQYLAQRKATIAKPDLTGVAIESRRTPTTAELQQPYWRFKMTENYVSPMAVPGMADAFYACTGLEHTESGALNYEQDNHTKMTDKRYKKLLNIRNEPGIYRTYGTEGPAVLGVMGWGSSEGVIREAVAKANAAGIKVTAFHPKLLFPLPKDAIQAWLTKHGIQKLIVPELNYSGQFANLLKQNFNHGLEFIQINRLGGVPFDPQDILQQIEKAA